MTDNLTSTLEMLNNNAPIMQLIVMIIITFFLAIIAGKLSKKPKEPVITGETIAKKMELASSLTKDIRELFNNADKERQRINIPQASIPPLPKRQPITEPKPPQKESKKSIINDIVEGYSR